MFLTTKEDWDKSLNRDKAHAIYKLFKNVERILKEGSSEQKIVGAHLLDDDRHNELERRLEQFLIGEGSEGPGLIGRFLETDPMNYDDFISNYDGGKHNRFRQRENNSPDIEDVYQASVALLLRHLWGDCNGISYQDKIRPQNDPDQGAAPAL